MDTKYPDKIGQDRLISELRNDLEAQKNYRQELIEKLHKKEIDRLELTLEPLLKDIEDLELQFSDLEVEHAKSIENHCQILKNLEVKKEKFHHTKESLKTLPSKYKKLVDEREICVKNLKESEETIKTLNMSIEKYESEEHSSFVELF